MPEGINKEMSPLPFKEGLFTVNCRKPADSKRGSEILMVRNIYDACFDLLQIRRLFKKQKIMLAKLPNKAIDLQHISKAGSIYYLSF